MLLRRALIAMLSMMIALGASAAMAQRPDHGGGRTSTPESGSGTPVAANECSAIDSYMDDLDEILSGSGPFIEFIFSSVDFEELTPVEAEEIVEDGDEVIALLSEMKVPAPYQPGHDGLVLFLQNMVDFTRFYGMDSSSVPDVYAYDDAMAAIYQGEVAIAEACPSEIDDLGGYIFMDPATLEEEYGDTE